MPSCYQRTPARKAHRNGYKGRSLKTRVGEITLQKPQFREFLFETKVFERYSRIEEALINAIIESYLQGVSTRKNQDIVSQLGIDQLSPSTVSRISKELDQKVEEFMKRPIEQEIPYLFVDVSYFKAGLREDDYREILGARIVDEEDDLFWSDLSVELKERGLSGVKLIVSDGNKGTQKAIEASFFGASWQMCHIHFMRAAIKLHEALEDQIVAGCCKADKLYLCLYRCIHQTMCRLQPRSPDSEQRRIAKRQQIRKETQRVVTSSGPIEVRLVFSLGSFWTTLKTC